MSELAGGSPVTRTNLIPLRKASTMWPAIDRHCASSVAPLMAKRSDEKDGVAKMTNSFARKEHDTEGSDWTENYDFDCYILPSLRISKAAFSE